jgi:hypothetical protein
VKVSVKATQGKIVVSNLPFTSKTGTFQALVQVSLLAAVHKSPTLSSTYFLVAGLPAYSGV